MTVINFDRNDFSDLTSAVMPFNALADIVGDTMATAELALEHESYVMGEERFRKALERQIDRGEVADNAVAKPLLDTLVPALCDHIKTFLETKGRGRPHVSKKYLSQLAPESAAYITIKTILTMLAREESCHLQKVVFALASNIENEVRFGRIRDQEADHFKAYIAEPLKKRQGAVYKQAYLSAVEARMVDAGQLDTAHTDWPKEEKVHVGIKLIELCIESTGLCQLDKTYTGNANEDHQAISLSADYAAKLASRAHALAGISPMYQPMIVPPKPWSDVTGGGYWAKGRKPLNLIRVGTKRALQRYNQVEMPSVFKAVNIIQNTAWSINKDVLAVANMIVNWDNCPVSDIPSINPAALPEKPLDIDTNEAALKSWKKAAAAIYRKEKARQSRRLSLEFALAQANKFSKYNAIWFPYNLDWRGRVYAVPMFNPQGNDMTKGLLTFSEKVAVGAEGRFWLAVHGSNCAGVDKVSLEDRVKWVEDNESNILASAKAPLDNTWWADQDSPFCFLAFCFEWAKFAESGYSEEFESSLPLAFDGTCSGLQHFSAMLRDEVGGAAVNLLPADKPQDIYGIVAEKVKVALQADLTAGTPDEVVTDADEETGEITERVVLGTSTLAAQWLQFGVTRGVTKRSVMTLAYGSKQYGFADQVREDTVQPAIDSGKGAMFTHASQACRYMAKLIWDAVSVTVIAAVQAMEWLQKSATLISSVVKDKVSGEVVKPALPVHWTTPIGFPVWSEYRKQNEAMVDTMILGGMRLRMRYNASEKPEIDARAQATGIAPNMIHSYDASHLMMTAVHCYETYGITSFAFIHDSFGAHAGRAHLLFKGVRETMVATYDGTNIIDDMHEEFKGQLHESQLKKMPELPAKGTLDVREILKSHYTFS